MQSGSMGAGGTPKNKDNKLYSNKTITPIKRSVVSICSNKTATLMKESIAYGTCKFWGIDLTACNCTSLCHSRSRVPLK